MVTQKIHYSENWSAIYFDGKCKREYQFCKWDFENPHVAAKKAWPDLCGKKFEVKRYERHMIENAHMEEIYQKDKLAFKKRQARRRSND